MSISASTPSISPSGTARRVIAPFTDIYRRNVPECLFPLDGATWMLVYNQHLGPEDESRSDIAYLTSDDQGETWSQSKILLRRGDHVNVVGPALLHFSDGRIGMTYTAFDHYAKQHLFFRYALKAIEQWSEPVHITQMPGCHGNAGMRLLQLRSGRLIQPASWAEQESDERGAVHQVYVWGSDDGGENWTHNTDPVSLPMRGAMEPVIVELRGGRLLMFLRNQLGTIHQAYSSDEGRTWSKPEATELESPESCCFLTRVPTTDDLAVVWNHSVYEPSYDHFGRRCPLSVAFSRDEGRSWSRSVVLEGDPTHTYSMPVAAFTAEWAMFAYYVGHGEQSSGFVEGAFSRHSLEDIYCAAGLRFIAAY